MSDPSDRDQDDPLQPTGDPAQSPSAPPGGPYAAPAPGQPYAVPGQPPYGAPMPGQPPYGAPGQPPYSAPGQPYGAPGQPPYGAPGQPPYGAAGLTQPSGPPASPAPDTRPKTLAIVALALAGVGAVGSFLPIVNWFSWALLLAAVVLAIIVLVSRKQGGKGLGIAALVLAVVAWIVSIVVVVASLLALAPAVRGIVGEGEGPVATSPAEDGADTADGRQELEVVEVAFGRESFDPTMWWYVVILENPNPDHVFDFASIDIEALDAAGTILDTAPEYTTLLSGRTALTGTFFSVGQGEIASLDVQVPAASSAIRSPRDETGAFTIEDLVPVTDDYSTSVTGTISGDFEDEHELVSVAVVARAADGSIVGGTRTYVDRLPTGGGKVQFEAVFFDPLPDAATFEAYASL